MFFVFLFTGSAYIVLSVRFKLVKAALTDELLLEFHNAVIHTAEVAALVKFAKADLAVLGEDLHR